MSSQPVILIIGPTGVGKTEVAIELAGQLNGEIVSADSRLFYVGMDIGTAKPSGEQRRRVPHHCIDIASPDQVVSLSEYRRLACAAIDAIHSRGRLPIVAGGTGQYVRGLTEGWEPPEVKANPRLRLALAHLSAVRGADWLHTRLRRMDPAAAEGIDARNVRRTIRAIEVIFATGRRFSDLRRRVDRGYRFVQVGLRRPREELYARIDERIEKMFELGLLEEARRLLELGLTPDHPSMSAIGYAEAVAVLQGRLGVEAAKVAVRRATRVLARRQDTWFRRSGREVEWFDVNHSTPEHIAEHVRQRLRAGDN